MASRAKAKEEARARRVAEEQALLAKATQMRRLRMLGGVGLLAVIVIAVAIAVSSGNSTNEIGLLKGKPLAQVESGVGSLLSGVPQTGNTLGSPSAPITMTYFGDLECPYCQQFTVSGGFPQLVQNEVRQGKVKVVYQAMCTATCNSHSSSLFANQQIAALAAGRQNRFWNFVELFYHQQASETTDYVNEHYLTTLATEAGLSLPAWETARKSATLSQELTTQQTGDTAQGITGTPTLIFSGPKGKNQPDTAVPSYSDLQAAIAKVA